VVTSADGTEVVSATEVAVPASTPALVENASPTEVALPSVEPTVDAAVGQLADEPATTLAGG
jgi:hypothetical protein